MIRELARPEKRAFWGAWTVTLIICGRKGLPFLPSLLAAELAAVGAMKAWQAAEDLHALAAGAGDIPPEPVEVPWEQAFR